MLLERNAHPVGSWLDIAGPAANIANTIKY